MCEYQLTKASSLRAPRDDGTKTGDVELQDNPISTYAIHHQIYPISILSDVLITPTDPIILC
jgi:hypothetical protein